MFIFIKENPAVPAPRTQGLHLLLWVLSRHITELLTRPSICLWATALGLLLYEGTAPSSHELFQHSSHSGTLQQSCRVRQWETQATVYPWMSRASPTSNAWVKCLAAVLFDLRTFQLLIPFPQWKWNVFLPEKEMKDRLALCCWLRSCTRSPFSLINALGPLCVLLHINPTVF